MNSLYALLIATIACAGSEASKVQAPVTIPFELRSDAVLLKANVNGREAVLILDTGSGISVLDSAFASTVALKSSNSHANIVGKTSTGVQLATVQSLRIGDVELSNLPIAAVDLSAVQRRIGRDVAGTVGYDLFTHYVVTIDFSAKRIVLHDPKQFHYEGAGIVIPLQLKTRTPVMTALLATRQHGTIPAHLDLDLGSSGYAIKLSSAFVEAHSLSTDTTAVQGILGVGVGGVTEGDLMRFPSIQLGTLNVTSPSAALSHEATGNFGRTAQTDGTIGMQILRRTTLTFDYANSRAILEPTGRFDLADTVDASGIVSMNDSDGKTLRIIYITAGSAALAAGLKVGDEIVSLDNKPVSAMPIATRRALLEMDGARRQITVRRNGKTISVVLFQRAIM